MKKVLLGTSAIVAAGLLSTSVMAQDGFSVSVSGTYGFSAALTDQDDGVGQVAAGTRDHSFGQSSEVHFVANQTLDNGTRVRVQVELEGEVIADITDEVFARLSNDAWGTVEMGQRDGPAQKMVTLGPAVSFDHIIGCTAFTHYSGGGGNAVPFMCSLGRLSDSLKVTYYTPVINGIRAGVSYEPEPGVDGASGLTQNGGVGADTIAGTTAAGRASETIEAGLEYVNTFGDVSFRGSVVYAHGKQEASQAAGQFLDDTDLWNIGAQVGFGAFTIGGHYQAAEVNQNTRATPNGDDKGMRISVTYSTGPWLIGGAYAQREIEDRVSGGAVGDDTMSVWGATVRRTLGPGVSVAAGFRAWEWEDDDNLVANENSVNQVFFTTKVNF
jgi:outer membrane protein OmpU